MKPPSHSQSPVKNNGKEWNAKPEMMTCLPLVLLQIADIVSSFGGRISASEDIPVLDSQLDKILTERGIA